MKRPPKYELVKRLALTLPQAREEGHRFGPWFNVGKRPFALYWSKSESWMLRLPADHVMMLVAVGGGIFKPMKNGSPFWVYVDVEKMDAATIRAYLEAAWRHTAPKKLQKDGQDDEDDEAFA
ncbi:MAG TPA: hypothetical protein VNU97_16345 [Rhizomicrobium sp.]|nr:hypothetical protein [Rhizomicrobium sp.]